MDNDCRAPGHHVAETGQVGAGRVRSEKTLWPPQGPANVRSVWSRQQPAEQGQDPAGQPQPLHTQNEFMKVDLP